MNAGQSCDGAESGRCYVAAGRQPTISEYSADGVGVMLIEIADAGTVTPQHSHRYSHLTMLTRGAVRVHRSGMATRDFFAPDAIVIPAGTKHLFETLTGGVMLMCIHNTARSGSIEVLEENQIIGRLV